MTTTATRPDRFPGFHPTEEQLQGPAFARPRNPDLKHPLSEEQLGQFWSLGYISLPGLFTAAEAAEFSSEADRIYNDPRAEEMNIRYDFSPENKADAAKGKVLWKVDPFHDLSEVFTAMVRDRRICDALASIYGGREPRLFKDKLIYKPPHTHGNRLHQDYTWWQGFPTSLISVVIGIDAANEENGCTVVYPGYERGYITTPGKFEFVPAEKVDPATAVRNLTKPGDVLMFHCFTPHEAGPNNTNHFRRQVFLTYNDSADGEHYQEHYEHFRWYVREKYSKEQLSQVYFH